MIVYLAVKTEKLIKKYNVLTYLRNFSLRHLIAIDFSFLIYRKTSKKLPIFFQIGKTSLMKHRIV